MAKVSFKAILCCIATVVSLFRAAPQAAAESVFIFITNDDDALTWHEVDVNPAVHLAVVVRELIAAFAAEPSLRTALSLNATTAEATPENNAKFSLFLEQELASALDAQACLAALGGIDVAIDENTIGVGSSVVSRPLGTTNDKNDEARRNFIAYRSTVVLVEPPLTIEFPHTDGQIIAGDLVTVRLLLGLPHCEHNFPWRGTGMSQCRHFFLHGAEICIWLEQQEEQNTVRSEGQSCRSHDRITTCGHFRDVLSGGVPLQGLSPGHYALRVTLSFPKSQRYASANIPEMCNPNSTSLWRLADLTRHFVIGDAIPSTSATDANGNSRISAAKMLPEHSDSLTDRPKLASLDSAVNSGETNAQSQQLSTPISSTECGSYVDDSEWCTYRPACLDTETLGLVLLDFAPDSLDIPYKLGREDDSTFAPTSLDRSRQPKANAFNNDLPHRSRALTGHLSASSFAAAEKRGAVAWFDPTSDDGHTDDNGGSARYNINPSHGSDGLSKRRSGRVGLMFVESPNNVFHAATKALQLSYAAKEPSESKSKHHRRPFLDAVVPLTCERGGCQPAHATHNNAPAAAWLDGLLSLLFSNATTQVIHDPRAWASAIHEKTLPTTTNKSPVELLCFQEVVIPGESRALFRGPADARRFRFNARRYLGLSPVVMHPPPKVLIVQRSSSRRIVNLNSLLTELNHLTVPAQANDLCSNLDHNVTSCASRHLWWEANHPAYPGGGRGAVNVEVVHLEDLGSFEAQAIAFATAGVVVLVHGAAIANLIFAPAGAAVIELKQYGEFGTQPRDLCAAGQMHHTALRNARPPPSSYPLRPPTAAQEEGSSDDNRELGSWWCPPIRPVNGHAGAPMSFCSTMAYHPGHHDILVEPLSAFRHAAAEALAVTGLRPLACEGQWRPGQQCPSAIGWGA